MNHNVGRKVRLSVSRFALIVLLFVAGSLWSADEPVAKAAQPMTLKILGIGNSFLVDATGDLGAVSRDAGYKVIISRATIGGSSFETHYAAAMLHEADPNDPRGKPYGKKTSLKQMLTSESWDIVTIQQVSHKSSDATSFLPHAKLLCDYIRKYAPGAEIVFHQTWAYREDKFKDGAAGQIAMYQGLTRAYHSMAKELGIRRIIPVGDAFQLTWESPVGKYQPDPNFDYKNAKYPARPADKNSLHAGFSWRKTGAGDGPRDHDDPMGKADASGMRSSNDRGHLGPDGKYLAACVWFEFLFKSDVRKIGYKPSSMENERSEFLKNIAYRVVSEGVRPAAWPQGVE